MDEYLLSELGIDPQQPQPTETSYLDSQGYEPPAMGMEQDFTDEDVLASVVPGYVSDDVMSGELQAPDFAMSPEASIPSAEAQDQGNTSSKVSASVSGKGFSPQKYAQIQRGPAGDLARANDAAKAEGAEKGKAMAGILFSASQQATAAEDANTKAQIDYDTALAGQKAWMAGKHQEFATKEAEAHAQAQSLSAQRKADYVAALNDYRASGVNPAQLWGNMSGGEQVGMLATAFVQDFLGVKGIKTSAMDTFNKAIDRNINAQIEGIRIKGDVAQGFKQLWDMQRAESSSDAEARARVRGFMLDSLKLEVEQHMAGFNSGLVTAKGEAAKAKLNAELAKNIFEVNKHVDDHTAQLLQQNLTKYGDDLQHAASTYATSVSAANSKRAHAAQSGDDPYNLANLIPDVSAGGGGAMAMEFRPGTTKEEKEKVNNHLIGERRMSRNAQEYRSLMKQYESTPPALRKQFATANQKRMEAVQLKMLSDEILMKSGKAATDQEVERHKVRVPLNTWDYKGDAGMVVGQYERHGIEDLRDVLAVHAVDLAPDDPRRALKTGGKSYAKSEGINAGKAEGGDVIVPTLSDKATQAITRPDAQQQTSKSLRAIAAKAGVVVEDTTPAWATGLMILDAEAKGGNKESEAKLRSWATGDSEPAQKWMNERFGLRVDVTKDHQIQRDFAASLLNPPAQPLNPNDYQTAEDFLKALEGR